MNALRRTLTIALTVATLGLGALSTAPDASAHGFFHPGRGGHGGGFHHGFGRVGHRFGWEHHRFGWGVGPSLGIPLVPSLRLRAPLGLSLGRLSSCRRDRSQRIGAGRARMSSGNAPRIHGQVLLAQSSIILSMGDPLD